MAVELARLISEQLTRLPMDHPDRRFLEQKRTQTALYLEEKKDSGGRPSVRQIADFFLARRKGPYLDVTELEEIRYNRYLNDGIRSYADNALSLIAQDGNNSIAHLCLLQSVENVLKRSRVHKISDLRESLARGKVSQFRGIGSGSLENINSNLVLFDQQLQQYQDSQKGN